MITQVNYKARGYDCTNRDFVLNITMTPPVYNSPEADFFETEESVTVQTVQSVDEDMVTVHELRVTRDMIVHQCGHSNWGKPSILNNNVCMGLFYNASYVSF